MQTGAKFVGGTAVLVTKDILATTAYYRDVLGFEIPWIWTEEDPGFACAHRDGKEVFLIRRPDLAEHCEGHQHCFLVDNVDLLYAEHLRSGAELVSEIEDKPWGLREYTVRDCNGYHLRFGGAITTRKSEPISPENILLVVRALSEAEFLKLECDANPWSKATRAVEPSLLTLVAEDTRTDEAVGMAMASGDGRNVIYIHHVAVLTSEQRRGIGSALMDRLMTELRARYHEGVLVLLMTGKPAFYATYGFEVRGGCMSAHL